MSVTTFFHSHDELLFDEFILLSSLLNSCAHSSKLQHKVQPRNLNNALNSLDSIFLVSLRLVICCYRIMDIPLPKSDIQKPKIIQETASNPSPISNNTFLVQILMQHLLQDPNSIVRDRPTLAIYLFSLVFGRNYVFYRISSSNVT